MPRSKLINLSYGDIAPADMTLKLQYWTEELSPAQLAAYEQAEKEHNDIKAKLNEVVAASGAESLYLGEVFGAYQVSGVVAGLENIAKPVAAVRKENKARQLAEEKRIRADRERETARKRDNAKLIEVIDDDDDDEEYLPLSKRMAAKKNTAVYGKPKEIPKPVVGTRGKGAAAPIGEKVATRPSEGTAVGGLTVGETKKKEVVDLTKDEPASSKLAADSREVTFNKLQGKTFPSLVVVARPTLKIKETNINDRPALDAKVKSVLMQSATKYTEWLIQQGLVRSEQTCQIHPRVSLKLGMYSDASKFPYSGGYVWISDCCPSRFVSVFSGSMFEAAPHPPSVLLKLIYHWSCQTNVQNVVQWVKVDNLYVKGLFTWLRAVCTVALHQHMTLLGGPGKRIEVGVISLGTTSQGGQQKQVKVEVLGVLDPVSKIVRLRAVEPLADGEKNYKKRFAKILEPLALWVNKTSTIATDLTVDKGTLLSMGYKFINQSTTPDGKYTNSNIMDYLRTVVPRMFQNTLSLLSRQIIQQFLDELVWREWYGTTPGKTFDHIVSHIAEQTRFEGSETLVNRLSKVAANPFRDWGHLSVRSPAKALRADFFTAGTSNAISSPNPVGRPPNRNKRKEPSPPPVPAKKQKIVVKEEPKYKVKIPPKREEPPPPRKEPKIYLESFYYGIYETGTENDSAIAVKFEAECPDCHETFTKNIDFMDHLKKHAIPDYNSETDKEQCRYCLKAFPTTALLNEHLASIHPTQTAQTKSNGKPASSYKCIICRSMFQNVPSLSQHMEKFHLAAEMPFRCGCCDHMSSSQRYTIDHFHSDHTASGALQCPFCLKIFMAVAQNQQLVNNIKIYYDHLKDHMTPEKNITCSKCSLRFLTKGAMKAHRLYEHNSQTALQRHLRELVKDSTQIGKPKFKNFTPREAIVSVQNLNHVTMNLPNGYICLECGEDFQENNHIRSVSKCAKCKYHSACSRAILEHISNCNGEETTDTAPAYQLGSEMFCICGYSSSEGNDLARHLATCDRKSAYESAEVAQSNTVKCNMLDMLGLVRRDGEDEEDSSDGLLIPADQQQQLLSKSIDRENEKAQPTSTQNPPANVPAAAPNAIDDFNTQLSLDDLAPPQSVAPQPEQDRTPQLSDEYQSLATPRVAYNAPQYENNDYEMAPNN